LILHRVNRRTQSSKDPNRRPQSPNYQLPSPRVIVMYYVYVIKSEKDKRIYTGYTSDLKRRISEHNSGKVESTKNRKPLVLIYYEGCLSQKDALKREKYLKTAYGKRYIKNRLKQYFIDD